MKQCSVLRQRRRDGRRRQVRRVRCPDRRTLPVARETHWEGPVGTGSNLALPSNWSVDREYDHIFLQDKNVTFALVPSTDRIRQDVDMGLVRLNYKFGGMPIARY